MSDGNLTRSNVTLELAGERLVRYYSFINYGGITNKNNSIDYILREKDAKKILLNDIFENEPE